MISFLANGKRERRVSLCLPLDESFGPHLCLSRVELTIEDCPLTDMVAHFDAGASCTSLSDTSSATEV